MARKKNPTKKRVASKTVKRKKAVPKRKINPAPLLYIITAKGSGKKMHFDGTKFSERARVKLYPTVEAAQRAALDMIAKYPVLRKYRIAVEHNQHLPPKR